MRSKRSPSFAVGTQQLPLPYEPRRGFWERSSLGEGEGREDTAVSVFFSTTRYVVENSPCLA